MTVALTQAPLASLIDQRLRRRAEMLETLRAGVLIGRVTKPIPRVASVYPTAICFLAQGYKAAHVGGRTCRYDAGHFLLSTMRMPADTEVVGATPETPMLSVVMDLDLRRLGRVVNEVGDGAMAGPLQPQTAIAAFPVDALLADAVYRLVRTATDDEEWRLLGEGTLDEVYYRLVAGAAGGLLRERLARASSLDQVGRAIRFIEENLTEPLDVETLARFVGMSSSGFHAKFKEATSQSPMQFVKRLRLNDARNALLEGLSVTEAAFRVGYSSASQFSREFSRQYGMPPSKVGVVGAVA